MLPDGETIPGFLDRIAQDSAECYDVSRLIEESGFLSSHSDLQHVKIALDYHRGRRNDANFESQPFGARISLVDGWRYPPPIEDIGAEIDTWVSVGREVTDPLVKSRLNHLGWVANHGDKYRCALKAIDAYLNLLNRDSREEVYRSDDLGYALSIALQLRDVSRIEDCVARGLVWLERILNSEEKSPGAIITTLSILTSLNEQYRPRNVNELVEGAVSLFDDPHLLQYLFEIQISIETNVENRKSYARKSVDAWLSAATQSEGLAAASNLGKALEQARAYELRPEIDRITQLIQQLDLRPHMQQISVSTTIPTEELERFLNGFLIHETWQEALTAFGQYCPITSGSEDQASEAQRFLHEHPFQALTQTVRVDAEGRPIAYISNSVEHLADRVAVQAQEKIQIWGVLGSIVLGRIIERWSLGAGEIEEFFRCEIMPETSVDGFVLGFRHFSRNEWESALQVILPRIEESIRSLSLYFGFSILIPRRNHLRKRNLGELLDELKNVENDNFFNYLDYLLVNEDSTNLRNRAAHGLMGHASLEEATLAIHVACALRARTPRTESGNANTSR